MKEIQLSKGLLALVDDDDFDGLSLHKWHALKSRNTFYAVRKITVDGKKVALFMHRVIVGDAANGALVDHRDGDGLNNRRTNLRVCNRSENARNQTKPKGNITGFKGVSAPTRMRNSANKYRAQIKLNGKTQYLGVFPSAEDAYAAYCVAASNLHGEFASFQTGTPAPTSE